MTFGRVDGLWPPCNASAGAGSHDDTLTFHGARLHIVPPLEADAED